MQAPSLVTHIHVSTTHTGAGELILSGQELTTAQNTPIWLNLSAAAGTAAGGARTAFFVAGVPDAGKGEVFAPNSATSELTQGPQIKVTAPVAQEMLRARMCMCVYALHTCLHSYIHACMHAYILPYMHMYDLSLSLPPSPSLPPSLPPLSLFAIGCRSTICSAAPLHGPVCAHTASVQLQCLPGGRLRLHHLCTLRLPQVEFVGHPPPSPVLACTSRQAPIARKT